MKKALTMGLGLLLFLLLIPAGCSGAESTTVPTDGSELAHPYVIGISPLTTQLEYYVGYIEGIQKAAREKGAQVVVVDAQWDAAKQEAGIRTFIEDGVDAIICSPVDPVLIREVLQEAELAGIAVIVEMTYVEGVSPLVATDQYAGGRLAGEYAGDWMRIHCKDIFEVAILDFPYFKNINDRVDGFIDGLKSTCPAAQIVADVDAQAKMETARAATLNILEEYPGVSCVFGVNDDSAKGANAAFHAMGRETEEICVVGFDADEGCRRLIAGDEYIKASVAADTDIIGTVCIETALQKIEGNALPDWVEVQGAQYLVTQNNAMKQGG